ncbi:hypothetical protein [Pectobacterium polaris]|uniref:Uncharacterized protein n=1 Tax=Pectobacterium polaris TaxID=2042057 RepID=A0AAW5GDK3_9GAMM|nr:hypothetical protein [Pectobacterium polaris]MCL6350645.1 hypothetical protein [Pectobacterium polaris]MCL6368043.1 hypothetical protein [Pectobacterium polaris]
MYKKIEKPKENRSRATANFVTQKKSRVKKSFCMEDYRSESLAQENIQKLVKSNLSLNSDKLKVVQRNGDEHGLVPPTTHGRSGKFVSPGDPKTTTKGHHHAVPRQQLTRFERMIDRIGRVLATTTNVHVAVALDDTTLVISANQESADDAKKLEKVAAKLKDIVKSTDPLAGESKKNWRISEKRRAKDLKKMKVFLEEKYTNEKDGVETNEEVSEQLTRLINAVNGPVLDQTSYHKGDVGIYIVPTSTNEGDRSHNMHGELKVSEAIRYRRRAGAYKEKQVYIGGTLADCFACNASHKLMNEQIFKQVIYADWGFYSGGTHGGVFPNYKLSDVARDNEDRFKELTGTIVKGGNEPHVVGSTGPERGNSLNEDSDSDAEDVEELSAYAKARKIYIAARSKVKESQKILSGIEDKIKKTSAIHMKLLQEMKDLESIDTSVIRDKVIKEMEVGKAEEEKIIKFLEDKKIQLNQVVADLSLAESKVMDNSKVKLKYKNGKIKSGIKVKFQAGRVLHDTAWIGKTSEQELLDGLPETKEYSTAYQEQNRLKLEFDKVEVEILMMKEKLEKLEVDLVHANAQYDRQQELPKEIELISSELKKLELEKDTQEITVGENEDAEKISKTERKTAANNSTVRAVKGKQDFLNKEEITYDEGDGK